MGTGMSVNINAKSNKPLRLARPRKWAEAAVDSVMYYIKGRKMPQWGREEALSGREVTEHLEHSQASPLNSEHCFQH